MKTDEQLNQETLAIMANAMNIDLGEARTFYYDVLAPTPDDPEKKPRLFMTLTAPAVNSGMMALFGVTVMQCTGFGIPLEPIIMRNVLNKWLAKLDEMYLVETQTPETETQAERVLRTGYHNSVYDVK